MYCITNLFLFLCAIPLIKAGGLKIDGLLNLGDSWSYEYRILRSDSSVPPQLRAEKDDQDKAKEVSQQKNEEVSRQIEVEAIFNKEKEKVREREEEIAHQKDEEAARIQRDEEHLRLAEHVLRNEAGRLRKESQSHKLDQRQGHEYAAQIHYIHNTNIPKRSKELKTETVRTTESRIPKWSKRNTETVSTTEDSSNSDESDDSDNTKKESMIIYDDATENPKKLLRDASDYSDTQDYSDSRDEESSSSSEISLSFRDKTRQGIERPEADTSKSSYEAIVNIIKINNYTTPKHAKKHINKTLQAMVNKTFILGENTTADPLTTTKVTTVRTGDIFTYAHQVKDDTNITDFTIHLYKQTLNIFDQIKDKTNQDNVKKKIDSLMKSYQEKLKEFINNTSGQKIRTRLGTQKVVLNTIETAFRLLHRLVNFMVIDLDKKGILRHNTGTANRFQKAIDIEQKLQSLHACKKFGICRSGPGFSSFLANVMGILLKCDDKKFKQSMDAFTEAIKYREFYDILEPITEKKLKVVIDRIERENIIMLRAMVMVLKNTIGSQNKPMIVRHYSLRSNIVNSTLALLEVIDLLDTHIPRNRTNALEWADMKMSLEDFADDKKSDIQNIMETIIRHVMNHLKSLGKENKKIVSRNLDMILSLAVRSGD